MSEWWTYRLSDFLMFSAETYRRMFELHHRTWWPLQWLWAVVALVLLYRGLRSVHGQRPHGQSQHGQPQHGQRGHVQWLVLAAPAVAWAFLAWAFFATRYAQIHLAGTYFAWAAAAQAVLLAALPFAKLPFATRGAAQTAQPSPRIAVALLAYAIVVHPALGLASGRDWRQIEWFGMTPDATALATVAALAMCDARWRRLALPVPLLWLLFSAATLWTIRSAEVWSLATGLVLALATVWTMRRSPGA